MSWTKVIDKLPELTEPFMMYDDDNNRVKAWDNDHVDVLVYVPSKGILKARLDRRHNWTEIATGYIGGISPSHWHPLPERPTDANTDKYYWICAVDTDSFNYLPKRITEQQLQQAKDEDLGIHDSEESAQKECDRLNAL